MAVDPPQVNNFVYSDAYNFKLDLVLFVRFKFGLLERWPLISHHHLLPYSLRAEWVTGNSNEVFVAKYSPHDAKCRSHWMDGLESGSVAVRLLGLRVGIPPEAWMSVSCECCVLSCSGLCNGPIPHPEDPYRVWCVLGHDQVQHITANL
jgi:hypothetical protein